MTTTYSDEMDAVKSDLSALKADLAKLTKSVASDAQNNASAISAKAKDRMKVASDRTKEFSVQGRDKAHQTVRENPFISIAATAGIALIAGALFARR